MTILFAEPYYQDAKIRKLLKLIWIIIIGIAYTDTKFTNSIGPACMIPFSKVTSSFNLKTNVEYYYISRCPGSAKAIWCYET